MRKLIAGLSVAVALALAAPASAQEASLTEVAATQWDAATLDAFASLPVQDGGRVKPLDTYARFELLQISGRRSYEKADGSRISALEWLLDTLFFPGTSETYNVFLVESGEVMQALGLPYEKPRDRYSYKTLAPGRQQLFSLAQQYSHMEENQRTPAQNQMINLAHNISDFEYLTVYLRFARSLFDVPDNELFKQAFPEQPHIHFSDVLEKSAPLFQQLIAGHGTQTEEQLAGVTSFLLHVDAAGSSSIALALIPPADPAQSEWVTPGELLAQSVEHGAQLTPAQLGIVRSLERLEMTKADKTAFADEAAKLHALAAQTAGARGEYKKVPLEVTYYKGQFFLYSWMLYILAFLLAAVSWLRPRNKWLWVLPMVTLALPLLYHSAGIVLRCVIRERPPVSTLYETIVFITAVAVLLALVIELMNRQHIALSLGAFVGVLGLFLADKYEVVEGVDTMPSLIAVLDTNFWLATHVTTVTIGYSAGLLAGFIAHIYLLGRAFGFKKKDPEFYKSLTRMTYGVICFGLLFSILGTVLGGIWANDSWGRFWGWDPKENGALMIVLWELAIIHFLIGGYIRDYGLHMMAVFGGIIVAFSWFGVNLLGVGLHSYGFTSGVATALMVFYLFEATILFIGAIAWARAQGLRLAFKPIEDD